MKTIISTFKNFRNYSGRATRKEYWIFALATTLIGFITGFVGGIASEGSTEASNVFTILSFIYLLIILLPAIAVSVRRLHDTGRSSAWLLLVFIPFIGPLVLFVFYLLPGQSGDNQYGPNPKFEVPYSA